MITVTPRTLKILAAVVWYAGGIVLLLKGAGLFIKAEEAKPSDIRPWLAAIIGPLLGVLKAKFIFSRSCRKNLNRIASLQQPKIWDFFRPAFFAALALMILAGVLLSGLAYKSYSWLIGVTALDLAIAVALLGSSYIFWTHKNAAG
jgi:hypothetical protein